MHVRVANDSRSAEAQVHHGDGSEEIVRKLNEGLPPNALFFASIHLYDQGDASFDLLPLPSPSTLTLTLALALNPITLTLARGAHLPRVLPPGLWLITHHLSRIADYL